MNAAKSGSVRGKRRRWLQMLASAAVAGAFVVGFAPADTASAPVQLPPPKSIPQTIAMGTFYNGSRLRIEGTAPAGSGVVIVIEGSERDEFFNRKGRVGPIWLTVDRIHVKHAPSLFFRFSSAPLDSLLARTDVQRYELDEAAIMDRIRVLSNCTCSLTDRSKQSGIHDAVPDRAYTAILDADFLRLKHRDGKYREQAGAVSLVPSASGTTYALEFEWPRSIPPGAYRIGAYACRGHQVIAQSSTTLRLVEVGFPAYMAHLAFTKPWMYGFGAVLVAVLAGFLTDLLTNGLRRKRRTRKQPEPDEPAPPSSTPEETALETRETETSHRG